MRLDRGHAPLIIATASTVALVTWLAVGTQRDSYAGATGNGLEPAAQEHAADSPSMDESGRTGKATRRLDENERADAIRRAQVWRQPRVPVGRASFKGEMVEELSCRFKVTDLGGTTPKFDCELEDGEEIRIKYGNGPEIPAEAAATRLLRALGFGADAMTLVRTLRCYGCPKEPFSTMRAVEITRSEPLYEHVVNFDDYVEFEWVAVERKLDAWPIESHAAEGWSFFELDSIEPSRGGAPQAHVDALRLIALLLAHWDNKSENQRLVCLTQHWAEGTRCPRPFLLLQDVGATFGPTKLDLAGWKRAPIWEDRTTCTVSMRTLPFGGATFNSTRITEAGRRFATSLLSPLSREQIAELFTHARFGEKRGMFTPVSPISGWVDAFTAKVRAISTGPRCGAA